MKKVILQAVWGHDYDFRTDQIYKCPCCPKCMEIIIKDDDNYICASCRKTVSVDDDKMKKWFEERQGTKVEYTDCHQLRMRDKSLIMGCDGKKCVKTTYVKNPATLEWQIASGVCEKCGMRFLV